MAIVKIVGAIHSSKTGNRHGFVANAINYILNPNKTDGGRLTGASNCIKSKALEEMIATKQLYGKDTGGKHDRQAYHFVISWSPEEHITEDIALEVIREFVENYFGNEYETVYSVHNDQEHIHGHIIFNSVNLQNGRKFRYEDGDWVKELQPLVDKLCVAHGLHTLSDDTGMTLEEYEAEHKKGNSKSKNLFVGDKKKRTSNNTYYKETIEEKRNWNKQIKEDIDYAILKASQYNEFESILMDMGYKISYGNSEQYGKVLKLQLNGMYRYRRSYALGSEYTLDRIEERIAMKEKPLPVVIVPKTEKLIISTRYFTKYKKLPLNPALKRYYRHLYQIGMKPTYTRCNYKVNKEAVERAEREEQKLLCCLQCNVQNQETVSDLIQQKQEELEQLRQEQKNLYEKHEPYKKMMTAYRKAEKLIADYELYIAGDESKRQQALEYEKQVKYYQKYGFEKEEIAIYQKSKVGELKTIREQIKKKERELEIANEILREYKEERENAFTKEEKLFYGSILETAEVPKQKNRKR